MSYVVLLVDDSSVVRSMTKRAISQAKVDVSTIHEAGNGEEALEILRSAWVDIVFADLNMPVMDGAELVRRMSEDEVLRTVPVVIVSSEHGSRRIAELEAHGIKAYVKKPFRPERLRDVIAEVLGPAEATDES